MPVSPPLYLQVALPVPLRRLFDYLPPAEGHAQPGCRVQVPFGRRTLVGLVVGTRDHSDIEPTQIKPCIALLDEAPLLTAPMLALGHWAARYYQHPAGEVITQLLPAALRKGMATRDILLPVWFAAAGAQLDAIPARAHQQRALLELLLKSPQGIPQVAFKNLSIAPATVKKLAEKGLAFAQSRYVSHQPMPHLPSKPLTLTDEQRTAVDTIDAQSNRFSAFLLQGITGSGKTEVYLQVAERILKAGKQVLILVPEISLTPQTLQRVEAALHHPIAVLHSGLDEKLRARTWLGAHEGDVRVVVATRSGIFTPLPELGLIVVDEEHDASFKQQDGFRYSARDLALYRAREAGCPVILGSATPALETLHNAALGKYQALHLKQRAGGAQLPDMELVDIRGQYLDQGLSEPVKRAIRHHLGMRQQVLVFLNRRGFAPVLSCAECGWMATCPACDSRTTLHQRPAMLLCHHCGRTDTAPTHCPACRADALRDIGEGTEKVEQALTRLFPEAPVQRVDRDSTRSQKQLHQFLARVNAGEPCILVGTQMLAKGHHFPKVTLVVMLNADGGFFTHDFRGPEKAAQLVTQVSGRAGRGEVRGQVLIQTTQPEHPVLQHLIEQGYAACAQQLLEERQAYQLPPFSHQALIRAEARLQKAAEWLLNSARHHGEHWLQRHSDVQASILGPVPSPLAKRSHRFRFQLLLQAHQRSHLAKLTQVISHFLEQDNAAKRVRWSIDIDPADMS